MSFSNRIISLFAITIIRFLKFHFAGLCILHFLKVSEERHRFYLFFLARQGSYWEIHHPLQFRNSSFFQRAVNTSDRKLWFYYGPWYQPRCLFAAITFDWWLPKSKGIYLKSASPTHQLIDPKWTIIEIELAGLDDSAGVEELSKRLFELGLLFNLICIHN